MNAAEVVSAASAKKKVFPRSYASMASMPDVFVSDAFDLDTQIDRILVRTTFQRRAINEKWTERSAERLWRRSAIDFVWEGVAEYLPGVRREKRKRAGEVSISLGLRKIFDWELRALERDKSGEAFFADARRQLSRKLERELSRMDKHVGGARCFQARIG